MTALSQRVANRYLVRMAAREVCASKPFRRRTASLRDLTPEVLEAFGEGFTLFDGRVAFRGLVKKLKKLVDFFKRAPRAWERIKQFLGIKSLKDIPKAIKDWAKKGLKALKGLLKQATETFPLSLFFVPQGKMPGVTDLMNRIMADHPKIAKATDYLLSRQAPDGSWPLDQTSGRPPFDPGPKGKPSKWVTLESLKALRPLLDTAAQEKQGQITYV